eukprot:8047669-Alexandrium_andersonii.AAC.1
MSRAARALIEHLRCIPTYTHTAWAVCAHICPIGQHGAGCGLQWSERWLVGASALKALSVA